jgi:PAS domain S-box-containing protein
MFGFAGLWAISPQLLLEEIDRPGAIQPGAIAACVRRLLPVGDERQLVMKGKSLREEGSSIHTFPWAATQPKRQLQPPHDSYPSKSGNQLRMKDQLPHPPEHSLLQFFDACPIGLVEFEDSGAITRINSEAVRLLRSCAGQKSLGNIFEAFGSRWPELVEVFAQTFTSEGPLVRDHRIVSELNEPHRGSSVDGPATPTVLSFDVVRVGPNQNMLTVSDVSDSEDSQHPLRRSEGRYRMLFDQAIDGIFVLDDRYRFVDVNPAACEMLGFTKQELLTLSLSNVLISDDVFRGQALVNSLPESSTDRGFWNLRRKDGTNLVGDAAVRRRPDGLVQGVVRDVTELRNMHALSEQHQQRAMQQQSLRETLVANAPFGIALYDSNFVCLEMNDVLANYFDISRDDSIGQTPATFLPLLWPSLEPIFERALTEPIHNVEVSGFTASEPWRKRWWLSSYNPISLPGEQGGFAVQTLDISERKRAELALAEQQDQLWSVFSSIDEGFCLCEVIFDDVGQPIDWRYLVVNPLFETMSGITDPVGKTILDLVPDFEPEMIAKFGNLSVEGGVLRFQQRLASLNRWFDVFATSVGVPGRFAVVFKDQTEKREFDAALLKHSKFNGFRAAFSDSLREFQEPALLESRAAEMLGQFLEADRVHFVQFEGDFQFAKVRSEYVKSGLVRTASGRLPLDDLGTAVIDDIRTGRMVRVADASLDERFSGPQRRALRGIGVNSLLIAPVVKSGRTVGAFAVHFAEVHSWSDDEASLVDEVAQRTIVAVDQARGVIRLDRRQARSEALAGALVELEQLGDIEKQARCIVEMLTAHFADYATFEVPEAATPLIALAHVDPAMVPTLRKLREIRAQDPSAPLSVLHAAYGESQILAKVTDAVVHEYAPDETTRTLLKKLNPRSHLAVPIELGVLERGALMVGISRPERDLYDDEDLEFLRHSALRFGVVIAATRLRREEHAISVRLQKALLPDQIVWMPDFDITARYHAVSDYMEVGGDWYDSFRWPTGEVGLMVGDVVGHNLESAAAMGRLRAGLAAVAPTLAPSPADLLDALHQCAQRPGGSLFVTAACVVIDPKTGVLKYASAGHPPTLVLSPSGTVTRLDDAQSPPLTPRHTNERPERTIQLEPGSLVFMYSDGLVERRGERIDYGISRLERAISSVNGQNAETTADSVLKEMGTERNTEDDVVVVCARYTPANATFEAVIAAEPSELAGLRTKLREWLDEQDVGQSAANDVLLAVGEACSNSVEHAYQGHQNPTVAVQLKKHDHFVVATVTDHGTWGASTRRKGEGGRGTYIMASLANFYDRNSSPRGTIVTLSIPIHDTSRQDANFQL